MSTETIDFANRICAGQGVTDLPKKAGCAAEKSLSSSSANAAATNGVFAGSGFGLVAAGLVAAL